MGVRLRPAQDEEGNDNLSDSGRLTQGLAFEPLEYIADIRTQSEGRVRMIFKDWAKAKSMHLNPETKQWVGIAPRMALADMKVKS